MKRIIITAIALLIFCSHGSIAGDIYRGFDSTSGISLVGSSSELVNTIEGMRKDTISDQKYAWELYVEKSKANNIGSNLEKLCPNCIFVNPKPKPRPLVPCKKGMVEQYAVFDFRASLTDASVMIGKSNNIGMKIDNKIQAKLIGFAASNETIKSIEKFCPECGGVEPKPLPKPIVLGPCK